VLATNLSKLLGIPSKKLEDIIYLRAYVVIDNGLTNLLTKGEVLEKRIDRSLISDILQEIIQNKELSKSVIEEAKELNEKITKKIDKSNEEITDVVFLDDYLDFLEKHCRVKIWTGTEAFRELLVGIDIAAELAKVKQAVKENPQKVSNEKLRFLQVTKLKEEDVIATNQHNNSLYRIILRCQRLNYYLDLNKSSGIFFRDIIHNEKRGLQKSVDQGRLFGSFRDCAKSQPTPEPNRVTSKNGSDPLQAIYYSKNIKRKNCFHVLANRAPSLHRLSIQGFYPQLTLGNSIELHPLITTALNADFDGDQIAIYLPITSKACEEVKERILSPHHIIDPKNGYLIDIPSQDMILGKLIFNQILPPSFPYYVNNLKEYKEEGSKKNSELIEMEKIRKKWNDYQPAET
ncbi:22429_t:CDS:2, partial [Entrophospora sp. SA101]